MRLGHDVTVLTSDWGLRERLARTHDPRQVTASAHGLQAEADRVKAVYLPVWLRYRSIGWGPEANRFCNDAIRDYDIVHIFGIYDLLGPAVAAACRKRKIPYVVEPIGMWVPIVRNTLIKRIYHITFGRTMLRCANRLIATSQQEVSELASAGFSRDTIISRRNGVEVPLRFPERGTFRTAHGIPQDAKLILFLGRLSPKKTPELLLQAFAALPARLNDGELRLVFAGPDESGMKAALAEQATQLAVDSRVLFCGALFNDAKWAAYRDADVFVLPSLNENFGNTVAEAMAAGTPVVVTTGCGIAPMVENKAGLVVEHEAGALAEAIGKVLSESELHERFTKGCREVTSQLDWNAPAQEMESLYQGLLLGKDRRS